MPNTDLQAVDYTVQYKPSRRARHLRITLRPDCSVTVTIPRRVSQEQVRDFVSSRQPWIQKHLAKFKERRPKEPPVADLSSIDLKQAQTSLFVRLESFAKQHQLIYRKAAFRNQKTKWGSCCKSTGSISLNISMVLLPEHLQDYILLHELTHLKHPNHSKSFWQELDRLCAGQARTLAKEIRNYPLTLFRNRP